MKLYRDRQPSIAVEFSSTHIAVAHVANGAITNAAVRALPHGALSPALIGTNVLDRDSVLSALNEVMQKAGMRRESVTVILPDACCRVALIDLDVVPERPDEADALIRLRLKKTLPFDVEKARVSWQVQRVNGRISVLAVVILKTVLEEYEAIIREAGRSSGLVLPAILTLLRRVDASVPTLLINVAPTTTSLAVVNDLAVVLVRVLERIRGTLPTGAHLADDTYPSLAFFQDAYKTDIQKIVVSGVAPSEELKSSLQELTGVRTELLVAITRPGEPAASTSSAIAAALACGANTANNVQDRAKEAA